MEDDYDILEPIQLKSLARHVWHAQITVCAKDAQAALDAVTTGGEADILLWHGWFENSDITYQLDLSSLRSVELREQTAAIRAAVPRARIHYAYFSCDGRNARWTADEKNPY